MTNERIPDPNDVVISFINASHSLERKYHLLSASEARDFWAAMPASLQHTAMIRPAELEDYVEMINGRSALKRGSIEIRSRITA